MRSCASVVRCINDSRHYCKANLSCVLTCINIAYFIFQTVIDSDDSDGETNSFDKLTGVNKIEKEDDIPKTKDKDSKTKPVAKNRTAVKRPGEDLFSDGVKLTKIDKTTDDQSIVSPVFKFPYFA